MRGTLNRKEPGLERLHSGTSREWVHVIVEPCIVYCGCNFSLGYGQLLLK